MELSKKVEEYSVAQNQYIIETGSMNGYGLYYLMEGEADIILDYGEKKQQIGKLKVFFFKFVSIQSERRHFWTVYFFLLNTSSFYG